MATEYSYLRSTLTGGWDVDYPGRTRLAKEIETTLSGKKFRICCEGTSCKAIFEVALSAGDETTLDSIVDDHQNNV